jgi:citrate lyase beta subunit
VTGGEGADFAFTLWTADVQLAARADAAGVDRIGIDLETLGKRERQAGLGTWISPHCLADLAPLRATVDQADLFARVNPLHRGTAAELDAVIDAGVEIVMLPMFVSADDVDRFCSLVAGRACVVLLAETLGALRQLPGALAVQGVDEVHIGINDMALEMGLPNRFSVMVLDEIADAAACANAADLRFGIAGVGRVSDEDLPIPTDLVYAQYARLGARGALLSRSFFEPDPEAIDLEAELVRSHERLAWWRTRTPEELEEARGALACAAAKAGTW